MAEKRKDFRKIAELVLSRVGQASWPYFTGSVAEKLAEVADSAFLEGYRAAQEDAGGLGKGGEPLPPVEEAGTSPAASEGDSQIHPDCTPRESDVAGRDFAAVLSEGDSRISREVWRWEGRREGLQEGREAGRKEGFEAGRAKGYVDGHADGREEVQRRVAEAFAEGEAAGYAAATRQDATHIASLSRDREKLIRQAEWNVEEVQRRVAEAFAEGEAAGFEKGGRGLYAEGFEAGRNNGLVEGQKEIVVIADQLARARRLLFRARDNIPVAFKGANETYKAINEFLKETAPS